MKLRQVLILVAAIEVVSFTITRLFFPQTIDRMTSCLLTVTQ